jgi:phosphinothricin acetyltransferase
MVQEANLIRSVTPEDVVSICDIYNHYIENSAISFEYQAVSIDEMRKRIFNVSTEYPWLVYEVDEKIVAYAYASLWKSRRAYKHTLETTVYASNDSLAKGAGSALYQRLFELLGNNEVHVLMAVIALPNEASVAFHEKMGYAKAGHFKEVGNKFDTWIDVGYWQKML